MRARFALLAAAACLAALLLPCSPVEGMVGAPPNLPLPELMTDAQAAAITDVHVIYSNHLDVGFDGISPIPGTAANVINQYLQVYFPRALETAANVTQATGGKQRFIWTTQCWLVSIYLDCPLGMGYLCPDSSEVAKVRQAITDGIITWHAFPFNSELELLDASLLTAGVQMCQELNAAFQLPPARTLSQRDVPGTTRAIIPWLVAQGVQSISIGSNPFSAPPAYPARVCRWRDIESDTEVIVQMHPGGYGGIHRDDAVYVEGLKHVLIPAWQHDNSGPPTSERVMQILAQVHQDFPNAKAYASTFDAFLDQLQTVTDLLPEVDMEAGDTWIYGVGSDPVKLAQWRAILRARTACTLDASCDSSSASFKNFSRLLLKGSEHTWGGAVSLFLDAYHNGSVYYDWNNTAFEHSLPNPRPQAMLQTWLEQRRWAIDFPLSALPESHPIVQQSRAEFALQKPKMPDLSGYSSHSLSSGPVPFTASGVTFAICPHYGFVLNLTDLATGWMWSSFEHPLAGVVYQTFTDQDYIDMRASYGWCAEADCTWSRFGFGKEGLQFEKNVARQDVRPIVRGIWSKASDADNDDQEEEGEAGLSVLVELGFEDPTLHTAYGAPETLWLEVFAPAASSASNRSRTVEFTLQFFNKTATRLPESLWLQFDPLRPYAPDEGATPHTEWWLQKIASQVSMVDVMRNGSQNLHAIGEGGASLGAPVGPDARLSSPDAALVCVSPDPYPSPFPLLQPPSDPERPLSKLNFNLVNNMWGTNYIMWYPYIPEDKDAKFRFLLDLNPQPFPPPSPGAKQQQQKQQQATQEPLTLEDATLVAEE